MSNLQNYIDRLNGFFFWKEFSFNKNKFSNIPGFEYELADQVAWIDDVAFIYQIKEREYKKNRDNVSEEKWFKNTILKKAKKQIGDTIQYLHMDCPIYIENQRGIKFNIKDWKLNTIHKIILFSSDQNLPENYRLLLSYNSKKVGFIHIFDIDKYFEICNLLVTPSEISEYLSFREKNLLTYPLCDHSEKSILGQYLIGDMVEKPSRSYGQYVDSFKNDIEEFDISFLFRDFKDKMDLLAANDGIEYYKILIQFAKLKRNDLRILKKLVTHCIKEYNEDKGGIPYRVTIPRLHVGFVIFAVHNKYPERKRTALVYFTHLAKYSKKLDKYIGMSISKDSLNSKLYLFEWCYIENPWVKDIELDKALANNSPFLSERSDFYRTYRFHTE